MESEKIGIITNKSSSKLGISLISKQIRAYQLTKNVLVWVPLFAGHLFQAALILNFIFGFFSFCCLAAAGYILNDILDLSSDRQHPKKTHRPIANGELSIQHGLLGMITLFSLGTVLAVMTNSFYFVLISLTYFSWVVLYSYYLKKIVLVDVLSLAFFYSLRIIAGMVLIPVNGFSTWLIIFSFFFFLSLGFVKRYSEIATTSFSHHETVIGRNYRASDLQQVALFGTTSGFISVLVLMLYISSNNTVMLYHTPQLLWLISFVVLFWILRIWLLAARGEYIEDPVAFALKDKTSLITLMIVILVYLFASL